MSERPRIFLSPPHMCGEEHRLINEVFDTNGSPSAPMAQI